MIYIDAIDYFRRLSPKLPYPTQPLWFNLLCDGSELLFPKSIFLQKCMYLIKKCSDYRDSLSHVSTSQNKLEISRYDFLF